MGSLQTMLRFLGWGVAASSRECCCWEASSCNDDLPDMPELHGAFTLSNSEPHFCRKGKVQFDPPRKRKKKQIFVKEGQRLRVLRLGLFEVLHNVIPLPEDCYATCGTRLLRLNCTAMDESLNAGCTIHAFRRLGGGAVQVDMELDLFLGNGSYRCAQPRSTLPHSFTAGPPAHVPVVVRGVVPPCGAWWVFSSPGALLVPWLVFGPLGKAPAPKGSKAPPTARAAGLASTVLVFSRLVPLCLPPRSKEPVVPPPAPHPGPSLGPSLASLKNALALLSKVLSPSDVNRLRKLVDPPPLPQPVEPFSDKLAMELAAKMQHQEQLKNQVGVLQQCIVRCGDKVAETKGVAW